MPTTIDRCTCPHCGTSYTAEKCGLQPAHTHATVRCLVCGIAFDVTLVQSWLPWKMTVKVARRED